MMQSPANNNSDGLSNRFNSYQQSNTGSYIPPGGGGGGGGQTYAEQQTHVLSDTIKTQYQTESTANTVLDQLSSQRQQLESANGDVWEMRKATEETKRELRDLQAKYLAKKRKLYTIIAALGFVDFLLFVRIIRCHGSFFCF